MGVLGTNSEEENKLRAAASVGDTIDSSRRQSSGSSLADSSAYETAEESINEDVASVATETFQPDADTTIHNDEHDDADTIPGHTTAAHDSTVLAPYTATTHAHQTTVPAEEGNVEEQAHSSSHPHIGSQPETEVQSIEDFNAEPVLFGDENELNRRYTLDRIASQRSVTEDGDEPLQRALTNTPSNKGKVKVADLTWDSIDDKDNPQNWPSWKKWFVTFTTASICLTVSLGSSLYVSGVPELEVAMHASQELCISGLTFYLIGLALGPMIAAPLSEIFGRKWIYRVSLPLSMLFAMGVGLSSKIREVLVLRFFCGLIASPAMAVAGGSISDVWQPDKIGFAMAMFCLAPFLGPILGPIIGNFAAESKGWKWTMWVSLMFSGLSLPFVLLLPETYKPVLLAKRAKARGIDLAKPEMNKEFVSLIVKVVLVRPFEMLVVEPIVAVLSIYVAFVFAVLFGFFEAFPIIFISVYNMEQGVSGLPFISVGVGLFLGVVFYVVMDKFVYFPKNPDGTRGKRDEKGNIIWDAPETRLFLGQVGSVCLPISLFWLGWTSRKSIHWIVPTLSGIFFGFGLILIFFSIIMYLSMSFPPISVASALAANNFLRYMMAAVFPLFTVQMYKRLHIDWATSLFGFISLAMVPIPFLFAKYGPKLRSSSKYGYAALFRQMAADKAAAEAAAAASAPATAPATGSSSGDEKHVDDEQLPEAEFAAEDDTSYKV